MRIHKRFERNVVLGEKVRCGLTWFKTYPNCSWFWKDVNCKKCLKYKKSGETK